MDLKDKRKDESRRFIKSFHYAFQGIKEAVSRERNLQIHLYASCLVVVASIYFQINKIEWIMILLCIGGVITLELVNTAIEKTVDLVTTEYRPLAKKAKDIAAGAVLVYAILTVIIGILIFIPYIK